MSNANQQTSDGFSIEKKLYRAWKQQQRFFHLRGMSRLLIWAVVLILVALAVDWQIFFRARISGPTVLLMVVNLGILGWVAWHEWLRHLRRFNPLRVSLEVERKHPELLSVLVSYTQLSGPDAKASDASPALLKAMRNQAVTLTGPLDFREVVDFRQLRNLLLTAVCCLALFSTVSSIWSEHMHSLCLRMVGIEVAYPTNTQLKYVTGDLTIKEGDSIEIAAEVEGKIPDSGRLFVRFQSDRSWQELDIPATDGGRFTRTIPEIHEEFSYYVRISDAVSERYSVSVSPPPRIVQSQVFAKYPEYMIEGGQSEPVAAEPPIEELNFSVPAGTALRWQLRCQPAVRSLKVKIGEKTIDAKIEKEGTQAVFEHIADETFKYTFKWEEKEHGFTYDDVQHVVRAVPDMVPDVQLLQPSADSLATVNKTLHVAARAADDHGLAGAVLVYSVNGSEEKRIPLENMDGTSKDIRYTWVLKDTLPDLKSGDKLAFSIEVGDRHPPTGSHINISATRRLTIVDEAEYLEWFKKQVADQRELIARARSSQQNAAAEVARLKAEEKKDSQ